MPTPDEKCQHCGSRCCISSCDPQREVPGVVSTSYFGVVDAGRPQFYLGSGGRGPAKFDLSLGGLPAFLLKAVNDDAARAKAGADETTRRLWLKQALDFDNAGITPNLFRQQAGDKSASTRLSWKAMQRIAKAEAVNQSRYARVLALEEILASPEFAGVCDRDETELLLLWVDGSLPASKKYRDGTNGWTLDQITGIHNLWNDHPLSRSKIYQLLDTEHPQSLMSRIRRRWSEVRLSGRASPELLDAVRALSEDRLFTDQDGNLFAEWDKDGPELADVAEVNPMVYSAPGEDGEKFALHVWAFPRWSAQTITAKNVETAYGDNSPLAAYQRARIEELGRMPALLDRLRTAESDELSYSQSGRALVEDEAA
jgi:hypothetical protein